MNASGSGPLLDRPDPVVLRLLPHVQPPPARALVVGVSAGHEARALDARGYEVSVVDVEPAPLGSGIAVLAAPFSASDFGGRFDLVCLHHGSATGEAESDPEAGSGLVAEAALAACARALRPGGQLFGSFSPGRTSALLHRLAPWFDVVRCQPAGFADRRLELIALKR
jgi:SAM-dependent methyltransferase